METKLYVLKKDQLLTKELYQISKVNKIRNYESIYSKALLIFILNQYYKVDVESIKLFTNDYGKPYLFGENNIYFNITHSGDYIVCAISDKEIGVDLQYKNIFEYERLVKRFFSLEERKRIKSLDIFYEVWSKKEAYLKYLGIGLVKGLDFFSIYDELNKDYEYKFYNYSHYVFALYSPKKYRYDTVVLSTKKINQYLTSKKIKFIINLERKMKNGRI